MAISTYSELKTAIETWMARVGDTEISGNAADLVTLAEARLNTVLPLNVRRTDTPLTGSLGSRTLSLPADYDLPISLKLTTFGVETMLTAKVAGQFEYGTYNAVPSAWCINGSNIDLDVPCDQAHTFSFRYRNKFALSDDTTTNWLLTNYPNVYLQACLVEAEFLAKDWQSAQIREGRLAQLIEEVSEKDARQLAIAPLTTDPAISSNAGFNINSGI